jgi:hypothetical protein
VYCTWLTLLLHPCPHAQGFVEYLGVDLGELFAPAGLLPSDFLYDEGDEDEDDAASITSSSSGGSAWGGGGGPSSSAQPGTGGWGSGGGGGGVRDSAAVMMFQPRRLQRLKRRYEQLLRISLQVCAGVGFVSYSTVGMFWGSFVVWFTP